MAQLPPNKKRRLSPTSESQSKSPDPSDDETSTLLNSRFSRSAAKWDLEQDYERRSRKQKPTNEGTRLPIKTSQGRIQQSNLPPEPEDIASDSSSRSLDNDTSLTEPSDDDPHKKEEPKASSKQQRIEAQEGLARAANLINENPEEHISSLKTLAEITSSQDYVITQYGLITQMRVFQDIIPDYRIRPLSAEDMGPKVSKDVRKLRNFEQAIVRGFQSYVQQLARLAGLLKGKTEDKSAQSISLAHTATSCACQLINSVPHFNYRTELLRILVDKLSRRRVDRQFNMCRESLEKLFAEDEEGNASLEALSLLCKLFKTRNYNIDESVMNAFLHLRLLSEFSQKGSNIGIDRDPQQSKQQLRKARRKEKKEFKTKKDRKLEKERKAIQTEFKEADALVSHEERELRQGEMLRLVFGVYFRILKERIPRLMGAVLEGLVKYAHLINQDFFGDLLEALRDLIEGMETEKEDGAGNDEDALPDALDDVVSTSASRNSLLNVATAFGLLQGQDASAAASSLGLDLSFFISHLYRTLLPLSLNPDIEQSSKPLPHPVDTDVRPSFSPTRCSKVNVSTTIVLLLRSLQSALLPASNSRSVPPVRLAAFTHQILTSALHMPEKSSTAMLGLMNDIGKAHGRKIAALWNTEERRGDGTFDPLRGEVEGANPFAGTVWVGELLRRHYAPGVREGIGNLEGVIRGIV